MKNRVAFAANHEHLGGAGGYQPRLKGVEIVLRIHREQQPAKNRMTGAGTQWEVESQVGSVRQFRNVEVALHHIAGLEHAPHQGHEVTGPPEPAPFPEHGPPSEIGQHGSGIMHIRADGTEVVHRRRALRCRRSARDHTLEGRHRKAVGHDGARLTQTLFPPLGYLSDLGIGDGQQLGLGRALGQLFLAGVEPPRHAANRAGQDDE